MESEKHNSLVRELASIFGKNGFNVYAVDGVTVKCPSAVENNNNIGDCQNKIPDIEAYDELNKRVIRGEAKIGNGDIESEHSITQYKLFSSLNKNGVDSWVYIIIPQGEKMFLEKVLAENVLQKFLDNIGIIESANY
ncbi:MAG: hypothetical protein WAV31_05055 [Candidatus Moraniibacteriota bacterium]